MEEFLQYLIKTLGSLGYPGIFLLMAIETTVVPLPSELVMPSAGYLASKNEMNIFFVILSGTAGSLAGAYVHYFLGRHLGRPLLLRYGKYLFISEKKLKRVEGFFKTHGEISVFTGRLLPVARSLISIPAGIAGMNHLRFSLYTFLGAGIWVTVLTYIGYLIGENEELLRRYTKEAVTGVALFAVGVIILYIIIQKHKKT